jgi:hypothetical protein
MTFQDLQDKIVEWKQGKETTLEGALAHLSEEVLDLKANPYDPLALADVGILWISICDEVGFSMEEMQEAIASKLAINNSTLWKADMDGILRRMD